ncbi:MAG: hypothetical protein JW783_03375 [Bacteroidales bacterium]|nr:hypothetical protein [Bacteroidales bacterium]MBN2750974.1 hypothetical protein [Bacteroidales bacterium]
MKRFGLYALMFALSLFFFSSCDKDDVTPIPDPIDPVAMHFDVWTPIGGNAGMGTGDYIVKGVESLESGQLDFNGSGVDLSQKLFPHAIIRGKYYYVVSKDGRFGRYQITSNQLVIESEIPFTALKERRHCHAWLSDNVLLLMGANGDSDKILWVKLDVEKMEVVAQGELALPAPPAGQIFNTSGMVAFRKADNTILYSFVYKKSKTAGTEPTPEFYMAFINSSDMSVTKTVSEARAEMMASTAYGELRQDKAFFDENGDYYIACNSVLPGEGTTTAQRGALLRVKAGAMDFDKGYNAYTKERGKIVTMTYMDNGKAILYMQDPLYTTGSTVWSSTNNPFVFYWIVADLNTQTITELKDIPFSNGNFSQLAVVAGDKVYIGANPKDSQSCIYVYNTTTGGIVKGMTLAEGFTLDRLVQIKD